MPRESRRAAAVLVLLASGADVRGQVPVGEFVGPASCDATACHGADAPAADGIARTEYRTWWRSDPHRGAWQALSSELSRSMGRRLGIADVTQARECLSCHALPAAAGAPDAPPAAGPRLLEFGVSCEACHGPASGWYGSHFQPGFDRAAASRDLGWRDLRDPAQLAAACVRCHVGDADHVVDHAMIASGHPELRFELGWFLLDAAPHWRQRGNESRSWFRRAALAGQLAALQAQLEKLGREAEAGRPDDSSLDCAACHHDVEQTAWLALREWRLARGLGTPPGRPPLEGARLFTADAVAAAAAPDAHAEFAAAVAQAGQALDRAAPAPDVARAAAEGARQCGLLLQALAALPADAPAAEEVARRLLEEADRAAAQGFRGAEQAVWLLHSLRVEFESGSWSPEQGGAASSISALLGAPLSVRGSYDPGSFARRLRALMRTD